VARLGVPAVLAAVLCGPAFYAWGNPPAASSAVEGYSTSVEYTEQERAWIREHGPVRYAIDPYWPMEYRDAHGQHRGLTREYIDHIEKVTGLVFEQVDSPDLQHSLQMIERGELDAVSAVSVRLLDDDIRHQLLFSDPYFVGASVIITKAARPITYNPAKLEGQLVAVKGGGGYERYLRRNYPGIQLLLLNDPNQALMAVDEGVADAAIGLDQALRPLVRNKYLDQLHLSGVISDMPAVIAMGLSPNEPLLKSIIDKALGTLTSRETDLIDARWVAQSDFGAPSWRTLLRYYQWELFTLSLGVLLLAVFARHATLARKSAQHSEGVKTAFLAMMSHEIRTPMNAIVSSLELLRRTPLENRQEQLAAMASNSAGNLLELLDNVLDLSRLEARRVELDPQPTDLWGLAEAVADIHRLAAQSKGVGLYLHCDGPDAPRVCVDAVRLRQILSNLLANAVKFTAQGRVDLRLSLSDSGLLSIDVSDTGVGIEPARQTQLFQPFVQADSSTSRRYGGSGLGLAICKDLATLMGGEIGLDSQLGQGTRVWLRLPVKAVEPLTEQAGPVAVQAQALATEVGPCVLLVEDHPVNQTAISLQLEALGYRCEVAADGPTALARLATTSHIEGVLLDCQLPGMDGYEVAQHIRAREQALGLPRMAVLAISAANDDGHRERVFASDMDATLSKPLRLAELQALLNLWVPATPPGQPEHKGQLYELFVTSTEADLLRIEAALKAGEVTELGHLAHRIYGAALMVGATEVATLAGALEAQVTEHPPRLPSADQLHSLRHALRRAEQAKGATSAR
jgi:two-component system sensor histidine kinase EvgS